MRAVTAPVHKRKGSLAIFESVDECWTSVVLASADAVRYCAEDSVPDGVSVMFVLIII